MAATKLLLCILVARVAAERDWFETIIPKDYNPLLAPDQYGGPVHVDVSLYVISFYGYCTFSNEMTADMYFRQAWVDPRLTRQNTKLESNLRVKKMEDHIWIPDLFIPNSYSTSKIEGESFLSIDPEGTILYSQKITVKFQCKPLDHSFPFDSLECYLDFESFGMNTSRILIAWRGENAVGFTETGMYVKSLLFVGHRQSSTILSLHTGEYGRLGLTMLWNRLSSYYIRAIIMPLTTIVMLEYFTFFMSSSVPIPRILMSSVLLLCAAVLSSEMKNHLPHTSHPTALDIWSGFCFCFIFGAVCESLFVVCMKSSGAEEDKSSRIRSILGKISEKADMVSYLLYPVAFILFVIVFFATYLG